MEKMNRYDKMMDRLEEDVEKMHDAFIDAYGKEEDVHKKMELCEEYAKALSSMALVMSTMNIVRPHEGFSMMGMGFNGCKEQ